MICESGLLVGKVTLLDGVTKSACTNHSKSDEKTDALDDGPVKTHRSSASC